MLVSLKNFFRKLFQPKAVVRVGSHRYKYSYYPYFVLDHIQESPIKHFWIEANSPEEADQEAFRYFADLFVFGETTVPTFVRVSDQNLVEREFNVTLQVHE